MTIKNRQNQLEKECVTQNELFFYFLSISFPFLFPFPNSLSNPNFSSILLYFFLLQPCKHHHHILWNHHCVPPPPLTRIYVHDTPPSPPHCVCDPPYAGCTPSPARLKQHPYDPKATKWRHLQPCVSCISSIITSIPKLLKLVLQIRYPTTSSSRMCF